MDTFRNGSEEQLRHRALVALSDNNRKRTWGQLGGIFSSLILGVALTFGAKNDPLARAFGLLLTAASLDGAIGIALNRLQPGVLIANKQLCRRSDCRPISSLKAVYLSYRHPHIIRADLLPELRLVLDWGDTRWQVPLTHTNWNTLWEQLTNYRPEMPHWNRHPEVLRALAQSHEVPYFLPPQVQIEVTSPPKWSIWGLGAITFVATIIVSDIIGVDIPSEMAMAVVGAVTFLANRKSKRTHLIIGGARRRRAGIDNQGAAEMEMG